MHTKEDTRVDPCPVEPLSVEAPELPRGAMVDRFFVREKLGAGGMGVVYAAYDPELDRKVALKLLLPRSGGAGDGDRTRLVREAQALAKLSHPNVVAVHDVGTRGDRVWIAMEFVAGQTLTAWARERPRRWSEVLALLADTARGLAAAHGAGLVHRDIKPDNVMIGSDGRVRVMDFGLAHGRAAAMTEPELTSTLVSGENPRPVPAALTLPLTAVGAVQGTPAYMAPEQWLGLKEEAATDQFAWSVMAWELLFGERPFAAETTAALAADVLAGQRRPPPRGRSVPSWLRRTLERGLAPAPAQRWPTMAALLSALDHGKTRARLHTAAAALAGVALLAFSAEGYRRWDIAQRVAVCDATGAQIDQVWNDDTRLHLRKAFLATGVSYAATSAEKIMPWLDTQATEWKQARTDVCLNADVRGNWNEDLVDRAKWCLEDRQMDLHSLVSEFSRADAMTLQKAVSAVASLKAIDACLNEDLLLRDPTPPAQHEEIREIRARLSWAYSLALAGKYEEALKVTTQAREQAEVLDWPPLLANARFREGEQLEHTGAYEQAEEALTEAYFVAAQSGAWGVAANASLKLIYTVGYRRARYEDGLVWAQHGKVALAHAGDQVGLGEAGRLDSLGSVYLTTGAYAKARTLMERAWSIKKEVQGPDHPEIAGILNNLSGVYYAMGAFAKAQALIEHALAIQERALGSDHPAVAISLSNLAGILRATGADATALTLHERALSIQEQALGPLHPDVAMTLISLGSIQRNLGAHAVARALYERALLIQEQTFGPDHPVVASSLNNLANLHNDIGVNVEARALHERALDIRVRALGPDHKDVAQSLNNLAIMYYDTGVYAEARALNKRALSIWEQALGPDHPEVARCLSNLADVNLVEKQPDDAMLLLTRAIAIYDKHEGVQSGEWWAHFGLSKALLATGGASAHVLIEAKKARDGLRAEGASKVNKLAEVEQWLAEHDNPAPAPAPAPAPDGDLHGSTVETNRVRDEFHATGNGKIKIQTEAEQWLVEDRNLK